MTNEYSPEEISILIRDYLDGQISADGLEQFEQMLRDHADVRNQLRRAAMIEVGIADAAARITSPASQPLSPPMSNWLPVLPSDVEVTVRPQPAAAQSSWFARHSNIAPWIAMAIMAALVLFIWTDDKRNELPIEDGLVQTPISIEEGSVESTDIVESSVPESTQTKCVAILVDKVDAEFSDAKLDPTLGLSAGEFTLKRGSIHLRFQNGANMVLEGPAKFSILDDMNFQLHDGKLRAIFPPDARGFQIETPGVRYKDMGTEVGLYADSLEMASQVHVFQGMVSPNSSEAQFPSEPLSAGQAFSYRYGVPQHALALETKFIEPGLIGLQRWQMLHSKFCNQSDLIGYFPFYQTSNGRVPNYARSKILTCDSVIPDAQIGAATWAAGRWPNKRALMFEGKDDHVQFELPDQYEELSMAVWLKLDRIENAYSVILNSDGWNPGSLHWQLNRSGGPWMTGYKADQVDIQGVVPTGKWVHLASTISTETLTGTTYLNGRVISKVKLKPDTILQPGICRLGNWREEKSNAFQRNLSGRIDELMVWKRVLTAEEIRELVEDGKPSQTWNATVAN